MAVLTALSATPASATSDSIPMVVIGLPFAPETPRPVEASHVLYQDVAVGEIEALPATVKSSALNWIGAAKRSSINAALRNTLARMNLLATAARPARKNLAVRWVGGAAPFRIGIRNDATVTLHYRLTRVDTGQLLFERDITTTVHGNGVASARDNGAMRASIGTNFASAANCLDHAAYGTAPADCVLTPRFGVRADLVLRP